MSHEAILNDIIKFTERVMKFDIPQNELKDLLKSISDKMISINVMIDYLSETNQLLYVFLIEEDKYIILSSKISKTDLESITTTHPEAMMFEYELQVQFGFHIHNIIQNNIVIFQPSDQKGVRFNINIQSSIIKQISVSLVLAYREIENNLVSNSFEDILTKMTIFFGGCSSAHQLCFVQCVENLLGLEITDFQTKSRILMLELERAINHTLWMIMVSLDLGFQDIARLLVEIRNEMLSTRTDILGNQSVTDWILKPINYGDKRDTIISKLKISMNSLNSLSDAENLDIVFRYINQAFSPILTPANEYGLVGPLARTYGFPQNLQRKKPTSNRIVTDISESPRNIFDERLKESISSIGIVLSIIDKSQYSVQEQFKYSDPMKINSYSIHSIEAPNGRLTYLVHTDSKGNIDHIHISTPSLVNFPSLIYFLKDKNLKWFPIISRVFDMGIDPLDHIQITNEMGQSFYPAAFSFRKLAKDAILQNRKINLTQE